MKNYVKGTPDNGGGPITSGIPNRAFCLAAATLSPTGYSWAKAGAIWQELLCNWLRPNSGFADGRDLTIQVAKDLYGAAEQKLVRNAWKTVGL